MNGIIINFILKIKLPVINLIVVSDKITVLKPKKKVKRRTKEEILLARHERKKKVLKKAKKKLNDKIKRQ